MRWEKESVGRAIWFLHLCYTDVVRGWPTVADILSFVAALLFRRRRPMGVAVVSFAVSVVPLVFTLCTSRRSSMFSFCVPDAQPHVGRGKARPQGGQPQRRRAHKHLQRSQGTSKSLHGSRSHRYCTRAPLRSTVTTDVVKSVLAIAPPQPVTVNAIARFVGFVSLIAPLRHTQQHPRPPPSLGVQRSSWPRKAMRTYQYRQQQQPPFCRVFRPTYLRSFSWDKPRRLSIMP